LFHHVDPRRAGGLFLIVDHTGSDRNNDGYESVALANALGQQPCSPTTVWTTPIRRF
jgi:hypothetical protein